MTKENKKTGGGWVADMLREMKEKAHADGFSVGDLQALERELGRGILTAAASIEAEAKEEARMFVPPPTEPDKGDLKDVPGGLELGLIESVPCTRIDYDRPGTKEWDGTVGGFIRLAREMAGYGKEDDACTSKETTAAVSYGRVTAKLAKGKHCEYTDAAVKRFKLDPPSPFNYNLALTFSWGYGVKSVWWYCYVNGEVATAAKGSCMSFNRIHRCSKDWTMESIWELVASDLSYSLEHLEGDYRVRGDHDGALDWETLKEAGE